MLKLLTPTLSEWDQFVCAHPRGHVLQLWQWGEHKRAFGWEVARVAVGGEDGRITAGAQLLFRDFPLHAGRMAYLAMGPLEPTHPTEPSAHAAPAWPALWQHIHHCCRTHRATFLKWEPGIYSAADPLPDFAGLGFRPAAQTVQPPRTIVIDITGTDDAILARMNQGTRRKIRQSLKNEVRYYEGTREDVAKFTGIMQMTGDRNAFGVHSHAYYDTAYARFVPDHAALLLAEHEGDTLAGVMVFAVGRTAWYLYGASANAKRNLMASYGVQWHAIQWAKARGCTDYDLWGIPDEEEAVLEQHFQEREEGLWGVYGFKRGWGGQVVRSLGTWDRPYNALVYRVYEAALRLRERQVRR